MNFATRSPKLLPGLGRAMRRSALGLAFTLGSTACFGTNSNDDDGDQGEAGASQGDAGAGSGGTTGGQGGSSGAGGKGGSSGSAGASGKGGGGGTGAIPDIGEIPEIPAVEAAWTVFVYGHADHNLSNSMLRDLGEMARATLDSDVNVLVVTDWDSSQTIAGTDPPEKFPDGLQLFRIPGGGADIELVAQADEQNLDDPDVLATLVADVFAAFPARRRAVVLWDHGGAWTGGFGSDTQNGTVARPRAMPVEVVPAALLAGLEAAGVDAVPPLDLVAFDTCLMAGAEVIYPFRDVASVYVANAELDYGAGWDYDASFSYLAANRDVDAATFAVAEVSHWDAHHAEASANDALLRSHVAIDLTKFGAFADATSALTDALSESTSFDPIELGRAGFFALPPYASQFENAGSSIPGLRDFGQLLGALGASDDGAISDAAAAAETALADAILERSQGTLREANRQLGVHVEQSLARELTAERRNGYAQRASAWIEASGWDSLLAGIAASADSVAPELTHAVTNGDAASQAAPPVLEFETLDADVAKASVYLGSQLDDRTIAFLGLVGAGTVAADGPYQFPWDGALVTFEDGQPAMLDVWLDGGADASSTVLMVPGLLAGAAEEPLLTFLVFDASEAEVSAAVVSFGTVASTLSLSEIALAVPSATFAPLYAAISTETGETTLVPGDAMALPESGAYSLGIEYAGAGSYYLFTTLTDVWGNENTVMDPVTLLEPLGP